MNEGIESHILCKYEIHSRLGRGAFSKVLKAIDKKTGETVALKQIFDIFQDQRDAQRRFQEIVCLHTLGDHENIIRLLNILHSENDQVIYLVYNYMDADLHRVIRANILEDIHKQYITYQIIRGLKYIHSAELIHCDIKPCNILLNSDCNVKITDFFYSRTVATEEELFDDIDEYICAHWYRAPELILGGKYSKASDMWNLGCVIGEMLTGRPLLPGSSLLNQLSLTLNLIGAPSAEDIKAAQVWKAHHMLQSIPYLRSVNFQECFPSATEDAIDLVRKLLQFNPINRLSVEQAINHPYVAQFHDLNNEPYCNQRVLMDSYSNIRFYRDKFYSEIFRIKKEIRGKYLQDKGY